MIGPTYVQVFQKRSSNFTGFYKDYCGGIFIKHYKYVEVYVIAIAFIIYTLDRPAKRTSDRCDYLELNHI